MSVTHLYSRSALKEHFSRASRESRSRAASWWAETPLDRKETIRSNPTAAKLHPFESLSFICTWFKCTWDVGDALRSPPCREPGLNGTGWPGSLQLWGSLAGQLAAPAGSLASCPFAKPPKKAPEGRAQDWRRSERWRWRCSHLSRSAGKEGGGERSQLQPVTVDEPENVYQMNVVDLIWLINESGFTIVFSYKNYGKSWGSAHQIMLFL